MPLPLTGAALCFTLGALILLLGLAIFRADPRHRLNRVAAVMLFFGGLAALEVGLELSARAVSGTVSPAQTDLGRYVALLWQLFFPALLMFVLIFPQDSPWLRRVPGAVALIFLPYVIHLALAVVAEQSRGSFFLPDPRGPGDWIGGPVRTLRVMLLLFYDAHVFLFSLVNLAYIGGTLVLLGTRRRQARSPRLRAQLRVITWGLGVCLVLYAVADPLPNVFGIRGLVQSGARAAIVAVALAVGSGSIAYAIVRHKFLDAGLILRRGILFLIPALALAMAYVLLSDLARTFFTRWGAFDWRLMEPLLLLVALATLQPLVQRVEEVVEGYLGRDRREGRTVLQALSRDIVTILDLRLLAERLAGSVGESLLLERCALYRRDGTGFLPLAAYDAERRSRRGRELAAEPRFAECGARLRPEVLGEGPQFTRDLADPATPGWQATDEAEAFRGAADRLGFDLFLPVDHGGEVLGVMALGRKLTRGRYTSEDLSLLETLANQTGAAMRNAALYAQSLQRAAMEEELQLARQIQAGYLPSTFPRWERVEVFGVNQPSRQVGGDYFDVLDLGSCALFVVADVSGKGVPAALIMSMMQASLRTQAGEPRTVQAMLERINQLMLQSASEGRFATCFLGCVHLETLELTYCNAGHNPPLLQRASGPIERLGAGGLILGAFRDPQLSEGRVSLLPGDRLLLYTDGLTEARNERGDFFEEEGVVRFLERAPRGLCGEELAGRLRSELAAFTANQEPEDDMTLMVVRVPVEVEDGVLLRF
ncbi:MAG TPA: GAF domain-containing SpoIIE family protein phosphatase [Candidatus Saccharimonadales bacterium]|nr:GAF domain-containing SpoIIE family protein phosphatase [Candidatus Saccharimonadales bacterium]